LEVKYYVLNLNTLKSLKTANIITTIMLISLIGKG